jgi:hypothetical protein
MQRGLQIFARFEVVALQDFFDPSSEPLDHSIAGANSRPIIAPCVLPPECPD